MLSRAIKALLASRNSMVWPDRPTSVLSRVSAVLRTSCAQTLPCSVEVPVPTLTLPAGKAVVDVVADAVVDAVADALMLLALVAVAAPSTKSKTKSPPAVPLPES